jgi:predicted DNA-binding transcriptional regulator YafY
LSNGWEVKISFFENKKFLPSQKIIDRLENGNLLLSFLVTQELEIEELIKKWLPYLKVVEPLSLDEKIKSDIKKYLI